MTTEELLSIKVKEAMSTDVISVREKDTMKTVKEIMDTANFHHIPVTDDSGNLKGIISKFDIAVLLDWGTNLNLRSALKNNEKIFSSQLAAERMNDQIAKVTPEDSLELCADIFKENIFSSLPVVSGKKLIGIITTYDLIKIAYTRKIAIPSHAESKMTSK